MGAVQVSTRASALSLAVSGFIVGVGLPWHPSIFDRPIEDVVRGFRPWSALHAIVVFVLILSLIGAAGLVAVHDGQLGRLGQARLTHPSRSWGWLVRQVR